MQPGTEQRGERLWPRVQTIALIPRVRMGVHGMLGFLPLSNGGGYVETREIRRLRDSRASGSKIWPSAC
ncbi:protein of unknown function [Pararobbsia alpina]